jgi:hypothetical protein
MRTTHRRGFTILQVLVFAAAAVGIVVALAGFLATVLRSVSQQTSREHALQIAEAGVEYYRWHLAHDSDDYQDGTGGSGPYVHDFEDAAGRKIGEFALTITPPPTGSTVVVVKSVGTYMGTTTAERAIQATFAIPSVAKYAIAADEEIRIGEGTVTEGPVHSNTGVRFDGIAYGIVSSARDVYDDPDHSGANEFGVHTHDSPQDPLPPNDVPERTDVFTVGREFPVPALDFEGMVADLANIKTKAQADGRYHNASGNQGFRVVFKSNDTYDLYRVTSKNTPGSQCRNETGDDNWGTWTIKNQTFVGNYSFPTNGLIFIEDDVWVEGTITTARLTLAAARFPTAPGNYRNIIINADLNYGAEDGSAVLGLIAQDSINVGLTSDNDLEIDAAMVAQHGRIGRHYYGSGCGTGYTRDSIRTFGSIVSAGRYGFAWSDGTGYSSRSIIYDPQLMYNPPPEFPLTTDEFEIISWEEVDP